jgi:hypothetical protein
MMRALVWQNILCRLGYAVPLVVLHDLGCLICGLGSPGPVPRGIAEPELCELWRQLLVEIAESDLVRAQAGWKHRDPMVGVVLARVLAGVVPQFPDDVRVLRPIELPTDAAHYARIEPSTAFTRYDQRQAIAWLHTLTHEPPAPAAGRRADRRRRPAPVRPVPRRPRRGGRGRRPRRPLQRHDQPGPRRRDRLLDGAAPVDPRGQARRRPAGVLDRRLRVDRAPRRHRRPRALPARPRRGHLRAEVRRRRALLLHPREADGERAAHPLRARRRLGLDARRA